MNLFLNLFILGYNREVAGGFLVLKYAEFSKPHSVAGVGFSLIVVYVRPIPL